MIIVIQNVRQKKFLYKWKMGETFKIKLTAAPQPSLNPTRLGLKAEPASRFNPKRLGLKNRTATKF